MKFLIDMNLPPSWVDFLKSNSVEAIHWSALGPLDASDEEILLVARQQNLIVITSDVGFINHLRLTRASSPSVVLLRLGVFLPQRVGEHVLTQLRAASPALLDGAVLTIDQVKSRVRLLPFE